MKKVLSVVLCTFILFAIGCNKTSNLEVKKDTTKKTDNDKYKIRDNYLETIQKQFPDDIFVAGMDLDNEPHNAQISVNYKGNKEKTLLKMAEIFKASEDFYKTQKVEYVYFDSIDNRNNDKGKHILHLENNKYVVKESTIQ